MEWLLGLALAPILLCGLMCVGGMALAAVGFRRNAARRPRSDEPSNQATDQHEVPASR